LELTFVQDTQPDHFTPAALYMHGIISLGANHLANLPWAWSCSRLLDHSSITAWL